MWKSLESFHGSDRFVATARCGQDCREGVNWLGSGSDRREGAMRCRVEVVWRVATDRNGTDCRFESKCPGRGTDCRFESKWAGRGSDGRNVVKRREAARVGASRC